MSLFDSASLVVTPNGYKEDKLYAIKPTDGSGDLVVTRATTATRVNSAGLIEQAPYNLLQRSEEFNNAIWTKSTGATIVSNSVIAPNGTLTADTLVFSTTVGSRVEQGINLLSSIGNYTFSFYAKSDSLKTVGIRTGFSSSTVVNVDITTEWQRYEVTQNLAVAGPGYPQIRAIDTLGGQIYIWGAQLVTGSSAKEYFPTTDRLDVPRLDYTNSTCPSILVEPQRTNIALNSQSFIPSWSTTPQTNGLIESTSTIDPEGFTNAVRITNVSGGGTLGRIFTVVPGTTYTSSIWVRRVTGTGIAELVDLNGGSISLNLTNEWKRFSVTSTAVSIGRFYIRATIIGNSIEVWGAQLEAGANATSYIPTVAATVTRNADVISKTGISSLIGQTEGTMFFDGIVNNIQNSGTNILNTNKNPIAASQIALTKVRSTKKIRFEQFFGNGTFGNIRLDSTNTFANGTRTKVAIRYKSGNFAMYINGNLEATSSSTFTNIGTKSELFLNDSTTLYSFQESVSFNSVALWKETLSNTELAQLTTI